MADFFTELADKHKEFISRQKIFFTATAPEQGRINLSPKGMDTFRVIDNKTVAYLDLTGSGNETAAHLCETKRMTIMLCAFDSGPLIMRLYGTGEVVLPQHPEWQTLIGQFPSLIGTRQIIKLNIESVQTSCGFSIPLYDYLGDRDTLTKWSEKKGEDGLVDYRRDKNQTSIDGAAIPIDYSAV